MHPGSVGRANLGRFFLLARARLPHYGLRPALGRLRSGAAAGRRSAHEVEPDVLGLRHCPARRPVEHHAGSRRRLGDLSPFVLLADVTADLALARAHLPLLLLFPSLLLQSEPHGFLRHLMSLHALGLLWRGRLEGAGNRLLLLVVMPFGNLGVLPADLKLDLELLLLGVPSQRVNFLLPRDRLQVSSPWIVYEAFGDPVAEQDEVQARCLEPATDIVRCRLIQELPDLIDYRKVVPVARYQRPARLDLQSRPVKILG
mmetsp:Transcript_27072/g.88508  ORF Transcript_27072/g.88508 Transcript_27072/m.88508 type:complete len:258 (-) Transcript_27072:640-1413(-)